MSKYLNLFVENLRHYAPESSNYELSKMSGVSQSSLSMYLAQRRSPSLETIVALAAALRVEPADLISDRRKKNIPADIIEMLDGQDEEVYETIRIMLKALGPKNKKRQAQ